MRISRNCGLFLLCVAAQAQQSGLRLDEVEKMALAGNPTMAQAQANISAAAGLTKQAGLYPNPTAGYYSDEVRGGYSGGGKQGGFISQTIVTAGKLRAARHVAELQAGEVETSKEVQRLRILTNVRSLFFQVLSAQRLVEVRQRLEQLARDATQTTHQLGNIGQADRPDVLQAEVEQQQASLNLRMAEQNRDSWWRMLAAVMGKPDLPLTKLEGDLEAVPELEYQQWVSKTLSESPAVKMAQQAVDRAEASIVVARKEPIPDLQVTANFVQSFEPLDSPLHQTGFQAGVQIGVQVPIFNHNQGNVASRRGETESARQDLARVKLELQREVAGMFREYDAAMQSVRLYKSEMLPRAEQAYRLYQSNYRNMAAAYPQVLISQRTLFQLEADYVQAIANAWQSALAIQGFGLSDGLSAPVHVSMGR